MAENDVVTEKDRTITVRLRKGNEQIKEGLESIANTEARSLSMVVEQILKQYLKNPQPLEFGGKS